MTSKFLSDLVARQNSGETVGITSVCSSHPIVLTAALRQGAGGRLPVLVEATCNQVNQDGGYTGLQPAGFRDMVLALASDQGMDPGLLILGGDHLGPNPWRHLPAATAMEKARSMVAAYARAGFSKIHLDTSMSCADDPTPLPEPVIAGRAAELASIAEAHGAGRNLVYVIGTEVPVPGGATEHLAELAVTSPQGAEATVALHREAFSSLGLQAAFERVVGLVVQPGVEFGHENVVLYDPTRASDLSAKRASLGLVYEAHSTDYQTEAGLRALVRDGFAILKVGPWLTFALREALYGLDAIAQELGGTSSLRAGMEALMCAEPGYWQSHYHGTNAQLRLQRHFSYSDRIRYYWTNRQAQGLVDRLMDGLSDRIIPETLISQYLAPLWPDVLSGKTRPLARNLLLAAPARILATYNRACAPD